MSPESLRAVSYTHLDVYKRQAIARARSMGIFTIGLTGSSGGQLGEVVDVLIAVPSDETPRIQECHILVGHALCDAVEQALADDAVLPQVAATSK